MLPENRSLESCYQSVPGIGVGIYFATFSKTVTLALGNRTNESVLCSKWWKNCWNAGLNSIFDIKTFSYQSINFNCIASSFCLDYYYSNCFRAANKFTAIVAEYKRCLLYCHYSHVVIFKGFVLMMWFTDSYKWLLLEKLE